MTRPHLDRDRLWLSFGLVALSVIVVAIIIGLFGTVAGVVTAGISAISTLVGFVVGHTLGAVGKEKSAKQLDDAHQLVTDTLDKLEP
jgi:predicted transporter